MRDYWHGVRPLNRAPNDPTRRRRGTASFCGACGAGSPRLISRAHTASLGGALDEAILEWAARDERLLLTHDVTTMIAEAYARLDRGEAMWGVLVVPQWLAIGTAIEEIALVVECSEQVEWQNRVDHSPLK